MHSPPVRLGLRRLCVLGLGLLLFPLLVLGRAAPPALAQSSTQTYAWDHYDVDLTINPDGSFDVVERQTFNYTTGTFRGAFRTWDTSQVADITNIQVAEGDHAYSPFTGYFDVASGSLGPPQTFAVQADPDAKRLTVTWFHDPVAAPATQQFTIRYHVAGGLRLYPGGDQLWWQPLVNDRPGPIASALVTVHLLPAVHLADVQSAANPPASAVIGSSPNNVLTFTTTRPLQPSDPFEVRVQWPHGLLTATPPAWQVAEDTRVQQEALRNLILLIIGMAIALGGGLFWLFRWYRTGRDVPTPLVADYLQAPPGDLAPALVGALVDEVADIQDVIATILDLGRKGNLTIREIKAFGDDAADIDYEYTLKDSKVTHPYEKQILDEVFGQQTTTRLSALSFKFSAGLPVIYNQIYETLVDLKYFDHRPDEVRYTNRGLARTFLILAALGVVAALLLGGVIGLALWALPVALALVGLIGLAINRALPHRTPLGADQAARWRAFRRYLADLEHYNGVGEAAQRRDQYLPYAVALGVDTALVDQFRHQAIPVVTPGWFLPWGLDTASLYPTPAGGSGGGYGSSSHFPDLSGLFSSDTTATEDDSWTGALGRGVEGIGGHPLGDTLVSSANMANRTAADMAEGVNDGMVNMIANVASLLLSSSGSSGSHSSGGWSGGGSRGGSGGHGGGGAF